MARTGVVLYHGIESGEELRRYGRMAEDAGFESIWVTERYFHEETFSLLGYLAAATESIRLGVGVVNPYTRNPALLAMATATLDRLSGGRLLLGLGRSDRDVIEGKMGIPYGDSRGALDETVSIIRRLLAGEQVSRDGRFALRDVGLAVTPAAAKVPIYLGAIGPKALRLAGTVADGVLLNAYSPVEYVKWAVQEVRQAAKQAGRDPSAVDIACMLVMRLTDDPAAIWDSLKERIVRLLAEPHVGEVLLDKGGFDSTILGPLRASFARDGGAGAQGLISDEMVESFYVVGDSSKCAARIGEYRMAGVDAPLLLPRLDGFTDVSEAFGRAGQGG